MAVGSTSAERERAYVARFGKSERNHSLERSARDFVLLDRRFQRPSGRVKTAILERMGLSGDFTGLSFDLIMTPSPVQSVDMSNLSRFIDRITLVEMKTTAKPIQNVGLSGFFFGSSETQYNLSAAAGNRVRWAFVVLNSDNDYGRPFFALLTFPQVLARTRNRRVQFQVKLGSSDLEASGPDSGPFPDPAWR